MDIECKYIQHGVPEEPDLGFVNQSTSTGDFSRARPRFARRFEIDFPSTTPSFLTASYILLGIPSRSRLVPSCVQFEFPFKVHRLLEDASREGYEHGVSLPPPWQSLQGL